MKSFLSKLLKSLHDLFTSKKFLAAAGSAVGAIATGVSPGTAIIGAGSAYVLGQGMADFGKEAKKTP